MMAYKKYSIKYSWPVAIVTFVFMILPFIFVMVSTGTAFGKAKNMAKIALYQGPDREKILIAGAKKEGELTFFHTYTWMEVVSRKFEKKYPFIKVLNYRNSSKKMLKRIIEEYAAGRFTADVISTSPECARILKKNDILQDYNSPETAYFGDQVKEKGESGISYLADLEAYIGLGFNMNVIPIDEAPKSLKDLVDPKWKGKMSIAGTSTGIRWIGNFLDVMGRDLLEKLSRQDIKVQNMSGAALATLVVAGEVPLSPTIYDSNIFTAKQKGAPVEWRPLEPAVVTAAYSGLPSRARNPHAAMIFLDYLHSKEGQKVIMEGGLSSPREDIGSLAQKFKKAYPETKYSLEVYEKKYSEWENLLKRLFIKRR